MSKTHQNVWAYETIQIPKNKFEWSFHKSFQMRVQTQHAPCLFHRIMQKWLIGIYWRKVTDE